MSADLKKKRTFKKFTYRGIDLDKLLDLSPKELMELVNVGVGGVTELCRLDPAVVSAVD